MLFRLGPTDSNAHRRTSDRLPNFAAEVI